MQYIPYGQVLRVRRICDSEEVCEKRVKELSGHIKRGFKQWCYKCGSLVVIRCSVYDALKLFYSEKLYESLTGIEPVTF